MGIHIGAMESQGKTTWANDMKCETVTSGCFSKKEKRAPVFKHAGKIPQRFSWIDFSSDFPTNTSIYFGNFMEFPWPEGNWRSGSVPLQKVVESCWAAEFQVFSRVGMVGSLKSCYLNENMMENDDCPLSHGCWWSPQFQTKSMVWCDSMAFWYWIVFFLRLGYIYIVIYI